MVGDGGGLAANRGREDLALERPAGTADADRERGDEEVQADHDHHEPGDAGLCGPAERRHQGEDDHSAGAGSHP